MLIFRVLISEGRQSLFHYKKYIYEKIFCLFVDWDLTQWERIPRLSVCSAVRSLIFSLQLLLAVALDRRPAWLRVSPLKHLSSPYTHTSLNGWCMSHVISMHRPGDPRQTAVRDLSKVILCLVAPSFEHRSSLVLGKQHHYSVRLNNIFIYLTYHLWNALNSFFSWSELYKAQLNVSRVHFTAP
jgi:hypothetical protein